MPMSIINILENKDIRHIDYENLIFGNVFLKEI